MKLNELDKLFMMNYTIGAVVTVLGAIGAFVSLCYEAFPFALHIAHAPGLGWIQYVAFSIFFGMFFGGIKFMTETKYYQDHYGA